MHRTQTEVLVVGAGPVGLWSALLLAESGIEVTLIDREPRTASRSYACALHPGTLELLDRLGLAESVIERGHRVETLAFYDGPNRQAEIQLGKMRRDFPFLLVLPQSSLEALLEQRLRAAGVTVHWNHRFEGLTEETESVAAIIEELEGTSTGYIVPHWENIVKNRSTLHCQFLIGADGHNSMVRPRAHLDYQRVGETEAFAAFEFETEETPADELRVVLNDASTNILWPLENNRSRWTFQILRHEFSGDFPEKERRAARLAEPSVDERIRQYVQKVALERAPWFASQIKKILWCAEVSFERRLVANFGKDRCWLVGDAAHQTGPAGVQSMNVGFAEVTALTCALKRILRTGSAPDALQIFNDNWQKEWRTLLGLSSGLIPRAEPSQWVAKRSARILPCLPGYGQDLAEQAAQLKLALS